MLLTTIIEIGIKNFPREIELLLKANLKKRFLCTP